MGSQRHNPLLSRRAFLGAASAATVAGAGIYVLPRSGKQPAGPGATASGLRKCLSMGPLDTPDNDDQDLRRSANVDLLTSTHSRWVKVWARWDQIQPLPPSAVEFDRLDDPEANPGQPFLAALDAQVRVARSLDPPVGVIVCLWRFPSWSNGTGALADGEGGDLDFFPQDRLKRANFEAGDPNASIKPLAYRVPAREVLLPEGAWGRWVDFLYRRYMRHGEAVALELANEPNIQWWPQREPSGGGDPFQQGELASARSAAVMMATAQEIAESNRERMLIAGPGTWDGPKGDPSVIGDSRLYTDYATFTEALLDELEALGFSAGPQFVWTQHNYNDTIYRHGVAGAPRNRAAHARELLVGRWDGYGRAGSPEVWLTEGGADLRAKLVAGDRRKQADLVRENWDRMADAQGDGAGIGMVTNYLGYSAPSFDTGLRDPLDAGGASRPVEATWRRLRSKR